MLLTLYVARFVGLGARFLLTIVAAATLSPHELEKYNYILALMQILVYAIGVELYQVVHRSYLVDALKKAKIYSHFAYYIFILLFFSLIAIARMMGLVDDNILVALIGAYAYSIFIELYRYSGVLKKPFIGEVGYAVRGILSLLPVLYMIYDNKIISIYIIMYCMSIDVIVGFAIGFMLLKTVRIYIPDLRYIKLIIKELKKLISKNINTLFIMASTAVLSKFLLNFDKVVGYLSESIQLSPSYYFSSVLAVSYFGMIESVANNKYAPMLLSKEISQAKYLLKQLRLVMIFGLIAMVSVAFIDFFSYFDRLEFKTFALVSLASALNMINNAMSIIMYSRKKDLYNLASMLVACFFAVMTLIAFSDSTLNGSDFFDLQMSITYISVMTILMCVKISILKIVNIKQNRVPS